MVCVRYLRYRSVGPLRGSRETEPRVSPTHLGLVSNTVANDVTPATIVIADRGTLGEKKRKEKEIDDQPCAIQFEPIRRSCK